MYEETEAQNNLSNLLSKHSRKWQAWEFELRTSGYSSLPTLTALQHFACRGAFVLAASPHVSGILVMVSHLSLWISPRPLPMQPQDPFWFRENRVPIMNHQDITMGISGFSVEISFFNSDSVHQNEAEDYDVSSLHAMRWMKIFCGKRDADHIFGTYITSISKKQLFPILTLLVYI